MEQTRVHELLNSAMNGCDESAREFVQEFERQIRLEIRTGIARSGLGQMIDSVDIAQSVFTSFLLAARSGEVPQAEPQNTISALMRIARDKLAQKVKFYQAEKRDLRRNEGTVEQYAFLHSPGVGPNDRVAQTDLVQRLRDHVGDDDFHLIELRASGCSWGEIGEATGSTADACRMRLARLKADLPLELASVLKSDN